MSDMQLLQQDYQLLIMVHGQAIKQVSLTPVRILMHLSAH